MLRLLLFLHAVPEGLLGLRALQAWRQAVKHGTSTLPPQHEPRNECLPSKEISWL